MLKYLKRLFVSRSVRATLSERCILPGSKLETRIMCRLHTYVAWLSAGLGKTLCSNRKFRLGVLWLVLKDYPYRPSAPSNVSAYLKLANKYDHYETYRDNFNSRFGFYVEALKRDYPRITEAELYAFIRNNAPGILANVSRMTEKEIEICLTSPL